MTDDEPEDVPVIVVIVALVCLAILALAGCAAFRPRPEPVGCWPPQLPETGGVSVPNAPRQLCKERRKYGF